MVAWALPYLTTNKYDNKLQKTVLKTLKGFNNHNPTWNVGNDKQKHF